MRGNHHRGHLSTPRMPGYSTGKTSIHCNTNQIMKGYFLPHKVTVGHRTFSEQFLTPNFIITKTKTLLKAVSTCLCLGTMSGHN